MTRAAGVLALLLIAACGGQAGLQLRHSEPACFTPGQTVSLSFHTEPSSDLNFSVQDDFGGTLEPAIAPVTTDANGDAMVTWQSPRQLATTTVHFVVVARHGSATATHDVHVIVGGNGRSC